MQDSKLIFYGLDFYVLNRFFYQFAKTKFVADKSRLVEHRDSWLHPWIVTSNGITDFNFTAPDVIKQIQGEMYEIWSRFFRVIDNTPIPRNPNYVAWEWVEQQKTIQRNYSQTISSLIEELNNKNKSADKKLAFSAASAAFGKLTADIALTLTGLGVGTGAAGLWLKSANADFLVRFGVGVGKSYGCVIAENWSAAKNADVWFTIAQETPKIGVQNVPPWVNDVYQEQLKHLKKRNGNKLDAIKKSASNSVVKPPVPKPNQKPPPSGVKMKPFPGQRPGWAQPNQSPKPIPVQSPGRVQPKQAPQPKQSPRPITGGQVLRGACYLLAIWSTYDSLVEFKKHAIDQEL